MSRLLSRLADDLSCYLAPGRVAYVLAGLAPAAARMWPWLLPEIREINVLGAERMVSSRDAAVPVQAYHAATVHPFVFLGASARLAAACC
jgi:hypothetical protein